MAIGRIGCRATHQAKNNRIASGHTSLNALLICIRWRKVNCWKVGNALNLRVSEANIGYIDASVFRTRTLCDQLMFIAYVIAHELIVVFNMESIKQISKYLVVWAHACKFIECVSTLNKIGLYGVCCFTHAYIGLEACWNINAAVLLVHWRLVLNDHIRTGSVCQQGARWRFLSISLLIQSHQMIRICHSVRCHPRLSILWQLVLKLQPFRVCGSCLGLFF